MLRGMASRRFVSSATGAALMPMAAMRRARVVVVNCILGLGGGGKKVWGEVVGKCVCEGVDRGLK
jgi:hypothetical protein